MVKKLNNRPAWIFLILVICSGSVFFLGNSAFSKSIRNDTATAPKESTPLQNKQFSNHKNAAENENCFKCHGQSKYSYENSESKKTTTKKMYAELIIDRSVFY
jgi:hypothetical protein